MSKKWLNIKKTIRQFSISILLFGGMSYLSNVTLGTTIITLGGLLYAAQAFMTAFETIEDEPDWEIVFPELALTNSEDLEEIKNESEKP